LKSAPIVEKENTLKKLLVTTDIVRCEEGSNKGDLEYAISIEDFGDIESQNNSQNHSFVNSIKQVDEENYENPNA